MDRGYIHLAARANNRRAWVRDSRLDAWPDQIDMIPQRPDGVLAQLWQSGHPFFLRGR